VVSGLFCHNGSEHVLAVTPDGETYAWGLNRFGQLGLGHTEESVHQPALVAALCDARDPVVCAATSFSHSLVLTRGGTVKSFGLNSKGAWRRPPTYLRPGQANWAAARRGTFGEPRGRPAWSCF
jgi:hypothetical protein